MRVVSNASPLINLACIGMLDLLKQLYGEIYIPEAVWREVVVEGAGQPGAEEVKEADWIRRRSVHNVSLVHALRQDLDAGESETIALALELEADFLIMDERLGRDTARYFGLDFTGLIGVFIEAKRRGFITQIKDHLDEMRDIAGFRISNTLYERVLTDEDEWDS